MTANCKTLYMNKPIPDILQDFLDVLKAEEGLSHNTLQSYQYDLEDFLNNIKSYKKIQTKDIQKYLIKLQDRKIPFKKDGKVKHKKISSRSIARKISVLKHFFQFLYTEGIRKDNPAGDIENPKSWTPLPKALTTTEVDKLFEQAKEDTTPEGLRTNAFLELFYATGMRVSELLEVKLSEIKRAIKEKKVLRARGKGGKERIVPLNPSAIKALKEYIPVIDELLFNEEVNNDFLFPNKYGNKPLTRQRIWQLIKKLAFEAGIDEERVSPHVLRHSFATHLLNNGLDIKTLQELLGHSQIKTTQIYTLIADDTMQSLVKEHHPLGD